MKEWVDLTSSKAPARCDAAVIGAGPYGLSAAAHLIGKGLRVAVFGKPLELWRRHMPKGMLLRSHWWATNLSDPAGRYGFGRFLESSSLYQRTYPVPIDAFLEYGRWFQEHAVPDIDETYVSTVAKQEDGFVLTLEDGREIDSQTVVVATGPRVLREPASGVPAITVGVGFPHE